MKSNAGRARLCAPKAVWRPLAAVGVAPILWVSVECDPDDVSCASMPRPLGILARPAACLSCIRGYRQYALTATCHLDQGGVLVLRSGLDDWVPAGSRIVRLARCRLDHDAIDVYWHSPQLAEITLTARQLPEPRGNDRETYGEYAV
jgi:hypothetical protein